MRPAAGGDTSASALAKRELLSRCSACRMATCSPAACEFVNTNDETEPHVSQGCKDQDMCTADFLAPLPLSSAHSRTRDVDNWHLSLGRCDGDADSQWRGQQRKQRRQQRLVGAHAR